MKLLSMKLLDPLSKLVDVLPKLAGGAQARTIDTTRSARQLINLHNLPALSN